MIIFLSVIVVILIITTITLWLKLSLVRKSADEIRISFADRIKNDTNTLVDISSHDPHMRQLAGSVNTQLKQLREERQRYLHGDLELKEAVTNIAHDLRTPLTAIYGYLQLIEKEEDLTVIRKYLSMITNRTEVMSKLTEELFRYSVLTSRQELKLEEVILNGVIEESIAAAYGALTKANIIPMISLTEQEIVCMLDRSLVLRIFENIIANAIKYSEGNFQVEMNEEGKITFSNRATNLDPVIVGRLFDRFYTVESGCNSTGLGLSIAKLLTERMGGVIGATYQKETLCIEIYFPQKGKKKLRKRESNR